MSDVSKFIMVVAAVVGLIWLIRAGWTGSLHWVEQQGRSLALSERQCRFWQWLTRLGGPLGAALFALFVPAAEERSQSWQSQPGSNYDAPTYGGERTLPPESGLCLSVIDSRAPGGPAMGTCYPLQEGIHAVGRAPTREPGVQPITIKGDKAISRDHLYLEVQENGSFQVVDRGSAYGTHLNNHRLTPEEGTTIKLADKLRLGNTTLQLTEQEDGPQHTMDRANGPKWQMRVIKGQDRGQNKLLGREPVLIGRNGQCNWRLNDNKVSRRHAEVRQEGQQVRIKDLGSSHGLYINGHKYQSRVLEPGDVVRLGDTELRFEEGA